MGLGTPKPQFLPSRDDGVFDHEENTEIRDRRIDFARLFFTELFLMLEFPDQYYSFSLKDVNTKSVSSVRIPS